MHYKHTNTHSASVCGLGKIYAIKDDNMYDDRVVAIGNGHEASGTGGVAAN